MDQAHTSVSRFPSRYHQLASAITAATFFVALGSLQAASYTWDAGGANDLWSTQENWVGDLEPTFVAGDTFNLTHEITANGVSTMDSSATLGIMNIRGSANGAFRWTLDRSGSEVLTLDNGTSAAQINTLLTTADGGLGNVIFVPVAITGNLNIDNQARFKTLFFRQGISSIATSGTQTITTTGNTGFGGTIEFRAAISDGSTGGQVALVLNVENTNVELTAPRNSETNTFTGGTTINNTSANIGRVWVLNNAFGPNGSTLAINGPGSVSIFSAFNGTLWPVTQQNLGTVNLNTNLVLNGDAYGRVEWTGATAFNLGSATRTVTGNGGDPDLLGQESLSLRGTGQTINNGTLALAGGTATTVTNPTHAHFSSAVIFNNADLEIRANATTTFGADNNFGTNPSNLPNVTVNTDGALNLSSGAVALSVSRSLTIASLAGAGDVVNSAGIAGTATLTINGTATTTFSGTIKDGGYNGRTAGVVALTKEGSGTQTLAGTNTYTGATVVNAGTLLINGSTASGSAVTVNGGTLGGTGTIGGNITVNSGGTLSPGNSIGMLSVGQLSLADGANLVFELTSNATPGSTYDQIDGTSLILPTGTVNLTLSGIGSQSIALNDSFTLFTGSVTNFSGATFNITNNTDWAGGWQLSEGSLVLTAIPEPSTWALLGIGLAAIVARLRRRK